MRSGFGGWRSLGSSSGGTNVFSIGMWAYETLIKGIRGGGEEEHVGI